MSVVSITASIQYKKPTDYAPFSWGGYSCSSQAAIRDKAKDAVRQSIHHLRSLLDSEAEFEESSLVAIKAYEALEIL